MNEQPLNKPILKSLEMLELVGVTFIRDYIQFLFDGPVLNTYTLPLIRIENKIVTSIDFGYYDNLCSLINRKIISSYEDENEERIVIKFEGDVEVFVSLKLEDRNCVEAVMLQLDTEGKWQIW